MDAKEPQPVTDDKMLAEDALRSSDYRERASARVARAREHLDSEEDHRLVYAALEARLAIEGLTYDLVRIYRADVDPVALSTWQPRQLFQELLAADPDAGSSMTIQVAGADGTFDGAGSITLKEHRLNARTAGAQHSALGSFLHERMVRQLDAGQDVDHSKMRRKIGEVLTELEQVLSSNGFNLRSHQRIQWLCRCSIPMEASISLRQSGKRVKCQTCSRSYEVVRIDDDIGVRDLRIYGAKVPTRRPEWRLVGRSFSVRGQQNRPSFQIIA